MTCRLQQEGRTAFYRAATADGFGCRSPVKDRRHRFVDATIPFLAGKAEGTGAGIPAAPPEQQQFPGFLPRPKHEGPESDPSIVFHVRAFHPTAQRPAACDFELDGQKTGKQELASLTRYKRSDDAGVPEGGVPGGGGLRTPPPASLTMI